MNNRTATLMIFLLLTLAFPVNRVGADVILKVFTVNPSKEQTQKVSLRASLPKEVKLEDIIDKEDLEIGYDILQGCYAAYGEYELKPGEAIEKKIEIRDIWFIPDSEIEWVRLDLNKLFNLFKNTEFSDRVVFLTNSIELKLDQIIERQKDSPTDPEQLFSNYRENLKIMESIKADLMWGHRFISELRPFPAANVLWITVFIIISLGFLGVSYYVVWGKQIKSIAR